MTPAGAPTVFVIDTMSRCECPSRAASVDSMIGLILYRPPIRRVRVRSEHINGMIGLEVNHSRVTGN
jgi:hypothetical protein